MRRALLVLALAGCSKILGIGDVTRGDAGGDTDSAPPNTVIGRAYIRYKTPSGDIDVPRDLTASVIRALIPDTNEASGFRTVAGSGKADGTFTISPVPDGAEYYLGIDRAYYVTTKHDIDHHYEYPLRGQPAPATATTSTTVNFALTNMTAWRQADAIALYDLIEVNSFALMYLGNNVTEKHGNVAWTEAYDWTSQGFSNLGNPTPLPDAAQGDDLWVLHQRYDLLPGSFGRKHMVNRTIDTFSPAPITLTNGGSLTVNGAFSPAVADHSLVLALTRGAFDSGFDPSTVMSSATVTLRANPVSADFSTGGLLAEVTFSDWSRSPVGSETIAVNYGDPFPAAWTRQLQTFYARARWILLPGTTVARPVGGSMIRMSTYSGGQPSLSPTLSPPSNIKVAGKAGIAGGLIGFDGVAPIAVSWNAVSGAKGYVVNVLRVYANGNQTRTQSNGSIWTTGTSVAVPAEMLSGSEYFAFTVMAHQTPTDSSSGQVVQNGNPYQTASAPTGMFRLSATCGNGTVDSGEACDTMGESASCDVDCTAVMCGDGLRNAAAGEMCDTLKDSDACDANCTPNVCGDGYRNVATEDCDDGNTTDEGNGCSTVCKFNNTCGNSVVQLGEQCDTGGDTATCDSDCTSSLCPDGHLNTAAGEQCDDANYDNTDHCTSSCVIN